MRRKLLGQKKKQLFTKRFYPAGNYTWPVPPGCTEVDVFIVGAGGGCSFVYNYGSTGGGGGGYTKTFKKATTGWRDGDAIKVTPGQSIPIVVGSGVAGEDGGSSQFLSTSYKAEGGKAAKSWQVGAPGGSGGSSIAVGDVSTDGGSDGSNGLGSKPGLGQGHTTRDFGEPDGKRNAGGGSSMRIRNNTNPGVNSDYDNGKGEYYYQYWPYAPYAWSGFPGGGYGGGAGPTVDTGGSVGWKATKGGDGTVLIRYWAYSE